MKKLENFPTIKMAQRKSSLFVSRFAPDISEETILNIVKEVAPEAVCEKQISKFPGSYSSFRIDVNQSNYVVVSNPELWPEGTFISRFFLKNTNQPK